MPLRLFRNLSVALVSAALALGAAEALLQAIDLPRSDFSPWVRAEDTAYRYAANLSTRMRRGAEYDVPFETNAAGLRDDALSIKQGVRVLLLGDSFASGYGVRREETFADIIEARLGVEVINAGVGGYEIIHQLHYFGSRGRALDPDLVVYALYLGNDIARNAEWDSREDGTLVSLRREFPTRVAADIKLLRLAKMLRYRTRVSVRDGRDAWEPPGDYLSMCGRALDEASMRHYQESRDLLAKLRDVVVDSGAELLVAMFSYSTVIDPGAAASVRALIHGFDARYDLERPAREVASMLTELRIDYVDLNEALRAHYDRGGEPLFFRSDGHFNAMGHRVVADALGPVIAARLAAAGAGP